MAAKVKYHRLESEIEKCRIDANWIRALELARQLSVKNTIYDYYVNFILGESKLEDYLKDNAAVEKNIAKAKSQLGDVEKSLESVLAVEGKVGFEAHLLLAKVCYCKGAYSQAMLLLSKANIDNVEVDRSSTRSLHIFAEAFGVKGLCLEKITLKSSSKFKLHEKEELIMRCYEMAGNLALLYLQEKEKGSVAQPPGTLMITSEDEGLGYILENAIQQSPVVCVKNGELTRGIHRFRELLRVVESRFTQGLRLTLARQLAEVLLRGVCEKSYVPLELDMQSDQPKMDGLKPRKYSGEKLFLPHDENEESLLLLLIAEAVATREAVLDRSAEHTEARLHTFQNITAVYDLLAIALVKRAQFSKLAESFERAMKFSFDEFHIWHQFANALISAGKFHRAALVLKECQRLRPKDIIVKLQYAKLCFEYLHQYDEGILQSEVALELGDEHPMASRVYVALGIGYSMKAMEMKMKGDRQVLHRKALEAFNRAHTLDPSDYLALFHLALQLAILRQISDAVNYVRLALRYRSDHIHSLHLLVLLLTAQKQYDDALSLLNAALEEYPDNLSLLLTKSKLEETMFGADVALVTCKHMLKLWKELHEIDSTESGSGEDSVRKVGAMDRSAFDRRSLAQLQLSEMSERDSGSVRAESIAASRMEQQLSELASSIHSYLPRPGSQQTWLLQAQIWLCLAELYLSQDKLSEAEACVQETAGIFPSSHQVSFMKGRVYEHRQKYNEAKVAFENAISINPGHTKSLQHLGMVLHYLDSDRMAEKVLRDAVNADPMSHQSWYCLGKVLESLGGYASASDCQLTAMELEATSPIVPFTAIPRLMQ